MGYFTEAIKTGNVDAVKRLISEASVSRGYPLRETRGTSAIWLAVCEAQTEIVRLLIEAGADPNGLPDDTPLLNAVQQGNLELVELLIAGGADVNFSDEDGQPPLLHAAYVGNLGIVQALVEAGADVNQQTYGESAILVASRLGHQEIFNYLAPLTDTDTA